MSDKTRVRKLLWALTIFGVIVCVWSRVNNYTVRERGLGVWFFFDDIGEAETMIIYDSEHDEVARYGNDEIKNLINEYLNTESDPRRSYPKYKREFKKHLGELLYTVEVVFSESRNDKKENRDIIKNSTTEILTVYVLNTDSFEEQSVYEKYRINIDGQDCVVVLRSTLLAIGN